MANRILVVCYILIVWFAISFVPNIIGPLMPVIIKDFGLSLTLAGFLPFSFFLAYGVVSIPAGMMVEAAGPKATLLTAFCLNLAGALLFALFPGYGVAVGALFVIGVGMAMLQVVINPLMRTAGGEAHFAFFSVMGQLVFGLASFVSPLVFAALMARGEGAANLFGLPATNPAWIALYWIFGIIFAALIAITTAMRVPRIELKAEERAGSALAYRQLFADRKVRLFFLAIAAYVGTEQSLANWMSQFLSTYHGVAPETDGARAVAMFWGWMVIGCAAGLVLLKLIDSKLVLRIAAIAAIACVATALFGGRDASLLAFPATGLCISVMFSIIFALALNSVPHNHGALSGILCTGILGGAIVPLIVGIVGEWIGLRGALLIVFATLGFILSASFWADPLTRNQTIQLRKRTVLDRPKIEGESR